MLKAPVDWQAWGSATEALLDGHALGEPVILVKKLDPGELFGETA
jgi:hypothetical protein